MQALTSGVDVWEDFFDNVQIGLALADLETRYLRVNRAYAEVLGRAPEDLVGEPFPDVVGPWPEERPGQVVEELRSGQRGPLTHERGHAPVPGAELWVLHNVSLVLGEDGLPGWFALSAQDITERRRTELHLRSITADLTERAVRDPLTGLVNRALAEERLRGALARDARTGGTTGVLFLDVDGFKGVNDAHGHAAGDAVLRAVAERLQAVVRPSDTVARFGGDEFVVVAEGTSVAGLEALVERLATAVDRPVHLPPDLDLDVRVSIGAASSTGGDADVAGLLARADGEMYRVKRGGRRRDAGASDR